MSLSVRSQRAASSLLVATIVIAAASCGSDGAAEPEPGSTEGPLYVYGTDVFAPDSETGYLGIVRDLDGVPEDLSQALEIPGGGMRFEVVPGTTSIVVRDRERVGMRKLEVTADGRFVDAGFVSFQGVGITNMNLVNVVLAEDFAVYFSLDGIAVEWDPATMTIIDTVPLPVEPPEPTFSRYYFAEPEVDGDRVVLLQVWMDDEFFEAYRGLSVLTYERASSTIEVTSVDRRCGALVGPAEGEDGYLYYACDAFQGAYRLAFPDDGFRPCVIRRRPGAPGFDGAWVRYLDQDDDFQSGLWGIGNNQGILQEYDPNLAPPNPDYGSLAQADVWRWRRVNLSTWESSDLGLAPGAPQFEVMKADGRTYLHNWSEDNGRTRLIDVTGGNTELALEVQGYVRGFARLL